MVPSGHWSRAPGPRGPPAHTRALKVEMAGCQPFTWPAPSSSLLCLGLWGTSACQGPSGHRNPEPSWGAVLPGGPGPLPPPPPHTDTQTPRHLAFVFLTHVDPLGPQPDLWVLVLAQIYDPGLHFISSGSQRLAWEVFQFPPDLDQSAQISKGKMPPLLLGPRPAEVWRQSSLHLQTGLGKA